MMRTSNSTKGVDEFEVEQDSHRLLTKGEIGRSGDQASAPYKSPNRQIVPQDIQERHLAKLSRSPS
jgi:hypothetical protein